ncbi:hypothetical protein BDY19DRAFT_503068 [Irpex rosettiformis]|uniref:Uncharacterized protein n=1 Tax=Irpex rosettiformis TaxID=378272 RepID=A0ACB8UER4_9APHY|nr:hypothetical protein BDY19DRAFT_503068 [Irpex rosettiformis]
MGFQREYFCTLPGRFHSSLHGLPSRYQITRSRPLYSAFCHMSPPCKPWFVAVYCCSHLHGSHHSLPCHAGRRSCVPGEMHAGRGFTETNESLVRLDRKLEEGTWLSDKIFTCLIQWHRLATSLCLPPHSANLGLVTPRLLLHLVSQFRPPRI